MGQTHNSVGMHALDTGIDISKLESGELVLALAGNPNVGKSSIFNSLTGMNQHTGNWPGKTVESAAGRFKSGKNSYIIIDLPGTYSLMAHSPEEEVARDFICSGSADAVIVVCDATCLERNMNLVLQTLEITSNVIVCVNLLDEAGRKRIRVDLHALEKRLGVPVIGTVGRSRKGVKKLLDVLDTFAKNERGQAHVFRVSYPEPIENAALTIENAAKEHFDGRGISRFAAMRLLEGENEQQLNSSLGEDFFADENIALAIDGARKQLCDAEIDADRFTDMTVSAIIKSAEEICGECVSTDDGKYGDIDRKLDRVFTGKLIGYPIMLLFFTFIFWLTITGANYPSEFLSRLLFSLESPLKQLCELIHMPAWLKGVLVDGAYRVLAWVVAVMFPPMAIFFPLFTLLEDAGYLPRVAYNLDKPFRKCNACGKQALTMCMGFGCNAAGVVGCRIIDSPRERLLAILTNSFVPCNGRFPTFITLITAFFLYNFGQGIGSTLLSSLFLTALIALGVIMTFAATKLLSSTVLRGMPSSFTFELPPYRRVQIGRVILRSVFDRTLFVLARSAVVAAPAGALIWVLANVSVGDASLLAYVSDLLDPFGRFMGLDGVILLGFILGFPANEIVLPIIIMIYTSGTTLGELSSVSAVRELLLSNGWTWLTALNTMLFSLMHWPCSTTLLTVKKETGSVKWTLLASFLPTLFGAAVCVIMKLLFGIR
ncbi:MAG: ferrous iron transport protein B [Clostridia bacterium]|nr:ferrous iron transport protein B [Clostridia bacterium]